MPSCRRWDSSTITSQGAPAGRWSNRRATRRTSQRCSKSQRETIVAIDPLADRAEAARLKKGVDGFRHVLIRAFGPDVIAGLQPGVHLCAWDAQRLRGGGNQVHLHARLRGIPHRLMREAVEGDLAAEFAVDAHQKVSVERGSDAQRIVISEQ